MPDTEPAPTEQEPRSAAWQTALTMLQDAKPPFIPEGAEVMTVVIEFPPGDPGTPPHRHSGPAFGYMLEGEMLFELEGEPERVIRAGEAFWEPGGDLIHTTRTATTAKTSGAASPSRCCANPANPCSPSSTTKSLPSARTGACHGHPEHQHSPSGTPVPPYRPRGIHPGRRGPYRRRRVARSRIPKTERAFRTVPMADLALERLREHVEARVGRHDMQAPLFLGRDGGLLRPNNWRRRHFDPAVERAGLVSPPTIARCRHNSPILIMLEADKCRRNP